MCRCRIAPEVDGREWTKRVLHNRLPVMVHFWSEALVPRRSAAMGTVVDAVALEFAGKMDAVRAPGAQPGFHGALHLHRTLPTVGPSSWATTAASDLV